MRAKHPEKSAQVLSIVSAIAQEIEPDALYEETVQSQRLALVLGAAGVRLVNSLTHTPRLRQVVGDLRTTHEMKLAYQLAVAVLDQNHYSARNLLNDLAEQFALPPKVSRALRGEEVGGKTAQDQAAA
jgi:hypothetical protein